MNNIANHKSSKFIIYSDSKSVLQTLQKKNPPLVTKLLNRINTLSKNNSIILTWIPSHIGIDRNESRSSCKKAFLRDISNTKIPYTDLKPIINKFILNKWQKSSDDQTKNKLHRIQNTISEWLAGYKRNKKEVTISLTLHWLYSDYPVTPTKGGHLDMLNMQSTPHNHILINCNRVRWTCPKYYQTSNLKDLFKNVKSEEILSFLKETKLFIKI